MMKRLLLLVTLVILNACGGGDGPDNQTPAPNNLSYPATQPLTVGQQMSSLTPTVTGIVSSYSVSPALPAGLILNSSSGVVSGTPTASTAAATYTVTATNAGGSTNAALALTVNDAAPAVFYSKTNLRFMKGVTAATITPTSSGGTNVVWSIHPTLPAGLIFDTSTGGIAGTPTELSASTPYAVTARNSGGSVTAALTITVESGALFDMGHTSPVTTLRMSGARVLSHDLEEHWVLWNANTRAIIVSGNSDCITPCVELIGSTAIISTPAGFDIRESSDGSIRASIETRPLWWLFPSDGSYIVSGNETALTVWSTTSGALIWSRPGDYANALAFAGLNEIRIARSPAGAQVIESLAVANGARTVSPAFSGTFHSWFTDGRRFLTTTSTTVTVFSAAAVQEDIKALPTLVGLKGQGDYFYSFGGIYDHVLDIYKVGNSAAPAVSYPLFGGNVAAYDLRLVLDLSGTTQIGIVDLSGPAPTRADHNLSTNSGAVAFADASHWVFAAAGGVIVDETTNPGVPALFGYGAVQSVAGSETTAAAATTFGKILYFDMQTKSLAGEINFPATRLELSNDGTVLVAVQETFTDRTLKVFSLPSATELRSETFSQSTAPHLDNFSLSGNGQVLGKVLTRPNGFDALAEPTTGGAAQWTISGGMLQRPPGRVHLTPNGELIAVMTKHPLDGIDAAANIYRNGALVSVAAGWPVGWVDGARLLINTYQSSRLGNSIYTTAFLANEQGTILHELPELPELNYLQPVSGDRIYSFERNAIYSLITGAKVWTASVTLPQPLYKSAVAGNYVVFPHKGKLRAEPY